MEGLDDGLLDVTVAIGEIADRQQGVDALRVVLADPEQDAAPFPCRAASRSCSPA
jgi:hypothetical protein